MTARVWSAQVMERPIGELAKLTLILKVDAERMKSTQQKDADAKSKSYIPRDREMKNACIYFFPRSILHCIDMIEALRTRAVEPVLISSTHQTMRIGGTFSVEMNLEYSSCFRLSHSDNVSVAVGALKLHEKKI